jgi:hypothetical protein
MQDPRDPGTLDLVEACKRPLTGAERQKRRRDKLKKLKTEARLFSVTLTADELDATRVALREYAGGAHGVAFYGDVAASLWQRFTALRAGSLSEDGATWAQTAAQVAALSASPTGDCVLDDAFKRQAHRDSESLRNLVLICTLRLRNSQHAELLRTVERLQTRLSNAGLRDDLPAAGRNGAAYHWNKNPALDYRADGIKGDSTPHVTPEEALIWAPSWQRA